MDDDREFMALFIAESWLIRTRSAGAVVMDTCPVIPAYEYAAASKDGQVLDILYCTATAQTIAELLRGTSMVNNVHRVAVRT